MKRIQFLLLLWVLAYFPSLAQITPADAAAQMVKGINLGNTLEPPNEGGWNNPKAQEYYFDLYKEAGFSCVRIPVRWDEHTLKTPPYTVNDTWMNRVEEIVDWGLKRGLFIIINAHHEEWIKSNYSQVNRDRFDSIWSQVSVRFKNKSEKLLFEIINEPYGLSKAQNDDLHKRILSVIRKTNPTRIVIFQGHNWGGSSELIQAAIPNDPYIIGSFHSYDPYLFGLEGQGTWGSTGDYNALKAKFQEVENWSVQNNIPVFLGEFGSLRSCDYNSRMRHYSAYVEYSRLFGFVPCAWDDGGDFRIMLRDEKKWDEVKDILVMSADGSPANIAVKVYQDSIVYLSWNNRATDCDSIIIQRRTTSSSYAKIATLPNNINNYQDVKPFMNQYYHYRIIARSKSGQEYYSYPQRVFFPSWIKRVRQPYLGSPVEIPGTVEAENFDLGGEGLGYHDVDDVNLAGAYRPNEAVDIYDRNGTGYHIGNALPGEWYEYLIRVKTRGTYKIDVSLAAVTGGGKFLLKAGNSMTDTLKALTSYSWLTTKNVSTTLFLEEGDQLLRFSVIDDPLFNIDRFTFELLTGSRLVSEAPGFEIHTWQNEGNELVIRLNSNEKRVNLLRIFTTDGKLVYSISHPQGEIILPSGQFPGGIYIIHAVTNQYAWSKKIYIH